MSGVDCYCTSTNEEGARSGARLPLPRACPAGHCGSRAEPATIFPSRLRELDALLDCYNSTEELKMEGCLESGDSLIAARLEYGRTLYPDYPMASFTKVRNVPIALRNVYEGAIPGHEID